MPCKQTLSRIGDWSPFRNRLRKSGAVEGFGGTARATLPLGLLGVLANAPFFTSKRETAPADTAEKIVDGKIQRGFRRYHAGCNHCHGPDGIGSMIGPSLINRLPEIEAFRAIVREGRSNGLSVMRGFAGDLNVAPYIDDIYAYLKARANGAVGRGRPIGEDQ